ncbi:MAG: hypothetical protein ABI895_08040 [Deltaproteobacteria bacterium]
MSWLRGSIGTSVAASALLLELTSCRVYRKDTAAHEEHEVLAQGPDVRLPGRPEETVEEPAAPAPAQALSLWVLNRSNTDLVARDIDRTSNLTPIPEGALTAALVVLGFGPPQLCADHFARRALTLSVDGGSPIETAARLLDEIRRWRWPDGSGSFAGALKGADGSFGAIQSAPAEAFSSQLLLSAVRRHGVIDGRSSRWRADAGTLPTQASQEELALPRCEHSAMGRLRGAAGVLLLSGTGQVFAGLIERETPADAGMMSLVAQYGVSLAAGKAGGVAMISDCPTLPDDAIAASVLASLAPEGAAPLSLAVGGCPLAHAILTSRDARVTSTQPLAWARSMAGDLTATRPNTPHAPRDAGAPAPQQVGPP